MKISSFNKREKPRNVFSELCIIIILLFFAALTFIATVSADDPPCTCGDICVNETGWWRAGADFNTSNTPIQRAINNATAGNTICVKDGTYSENVDVSRRLTIRSENGTANCIVNALRSNDHVFKVTSDYVNISGFTVRFGKAGIYLGSGVEHCNISDNTVLNSYCGIYLNDSCNNTLSNNIANSNYYGILLYSSSIYNTLFANTANSNHDGILLGDSSNYNTLSDNTANSNNEYGIYLYSSSNNNLTDNTAKENSGFDLYIFAGFDSYCNNKIENMTGSGDRPIRYYNSSVNLSDVILSELILCNADQSNISNVTIEGSATKKNNGVLLVRTDFSNLTNINSSNNRYGIYLFSSSSNVLSNNTALSNYYGIRLYHSSNNTLSNNVANSNYYGILLYSSSNYNTLSDNTANLNYDGILLGDSSNYNTLTSNTANSNSHHGMNLSWWSNYNTLFNNTANLNNLYGIRLYPASSYNTLSNNTANLNYGGILLGDSSNYNTLSNNTVLSNYYGIRLWYSSNNTLTNNTANSNSLYGIYLDGSNSNTLTNNTANSNKDHGIYLYKWCNNNTLASNTANWNSEHGVCLYRWCNNNTLTNNTANWNSEHGVCLYRWCNYNTLTNNIANANNEYGIYLYSSSNNNLTNNTAKENSGFDLYIFADFDSHCNNKIENMTGSGNRPIRYYNSSVNLSDVILSELILCNADQSNINNVTIEGSATKKNNGVLLVRTDFANLTNINSSNNRYGVYLSSRSNYNSLSNNTLNSNSLCGIRLWYSSNYNSLTNNTANSNGLYGIYMSWRSNHNSLSNNTASNNNYDFYSDEDSHSNTVEDLTIASCYPTTISFSYDQGIKIKGVTTSELKLNPAGKVNISKFVNATNVTADSWIFLNVSYRDADVRGVDEDSLLLYRWDETASVWELANETGEPNGVNTTGNYVYANVTSFSQIAPFGKPLCYKTTIIPSFRAYIRCFASSRRTGAVSASDEAPSAVIPVFKINPDGTTTVVETIEGSGPTVVTVTPNEDGSPNITREDRQISEEERHLSNAYKGIIIAPETELPVNIVNENFSLTAYVLKTHVKDVLKPYVKIDKDWRRGYYTTANNDSLGTGAETWDGYSYPFWW